jgi:Tim10/DDP family zinc finger.
MIFKFGLGVQRRGMPFLHKTSSRQSIISGTKISQAESGPDYVSAALSCHFQPPWQTSLTRQLRLTLDPYPLQPCVDLATSQKELSSFLEKEQAQVGSSAKCSGSSNGNKLKGKASFIYPQLHKHVLGQVCFSFVSGEYPLNRYRRSRCITGTPGKSFSRSEENCLSYCVERFLDTSLFMVRKIEEQRENARFTGS